MNSCATSQLELDFGDALLRPDGESQQNPKSAIGPGVDLTGMVFGTRTVVGYDGRNKQGKRIWKYVCRCGNTGTVPTCQLKKNPKCCQCWRTRNDISGKSFGMLTAIKFLGKSKHNISMWECRCDCGQATAVSVYRLTSGGAKSCGCLRHRSADQSKTWKGVGEFSGQRFAGIRCNARARRISLSVSKEYLWELFLGQDRKCALSGVLIFFGDDWTASLDRIDSKIGYQEGNVQWVHKDIQQIKMDFQEDELIDWCRKLVAHADSKLAAPPPPMKIAA